MVDGGIPLREWFAAWARDHEALDDRRFAETKALIEAGELRVMQTATERWVEHIRQHTETMKTLDRLVTTGTTDDAWRAEVRGQLIVLKWLLTLGTGVMVPIMVML